MRKLTLLLVLCSATLTFAGVSVTAPANGSTVSSTVQYVASATTSCTKGVSAMGIYTGPNQLVYTISGAKINTLLTLNPGVYNTTVEEWDNCGGASTTPVTITVGSGGGSGVTVTAPQKNSTVSSTVQYVASATPLAQKASRQWESMQRPASLSTRPQARRSIRRLHSALELTTRLCRSGTTAADLQPLRLRSQ